MNQYKSRRLEKSQNIPDKDDDELKVQYAKVAPQVPRNLFISALKSVNNHLLVS